MGTVIGSFKEYAPQNAIHSSKLKKKGCLLRKNNIPTSNVVIDLDKLEITDDSKCADFLFASDDSGGWVIPIEMKKGAPDVSHSAQQLQAAARIAEEWTIGQHVENFQAVLASGSMPRARRTSLRKRSNWVRFRNKPYRIQRLRCGDELRKVFD